MTVTKHHCLGMSSDHGQGMLAERVMGWHPHERLQNLLLYPNDTRTNLLKESNHLPWRHEKIGDREVFEIGKHMVKLCIQNHQRKHKNKTVIISLSGLAFMLGIQHLWLRSTCISRSLLVSQVYIIACACMYISQ